MGALGNVLLRLAEEALERGEFEVAEGRFRRVLAANPREPRARAGVGQIALARGEFESARAHFEAALAASPESAAARMEPGPSRKTWLRRRNRLLLLHRPRRTQQGRARRAHSRIARTDQAASGTSSQSASTEPGGLRAVSAGDWLWPFGSDCRSNLRNHPPPASVDHASTILR